jgi:hypothetical protein
MIACGEIDKQLISALSCGKVYIQVRHDQHESKLVKKETSNKILYQLGSSAKQARSGGHADSSNSLHTKTCGGASVLHSETTETGGQKALSARREGDWTCPRCKV